MSVMLDYSRLCVDPRFNVIRYGVSNNLAAVDFPVRHMSCDINDASERNRDKQKGRIERSVKVHI